MTTETLEAVALLAEVCGALETMGAWAPAARHPEAILYLRRWGRRATSMVDAAEVLLSIDELDPLAVFDLHADLRERVLGCQRGPVRPVRRFTTGGLAE